MISARNLTKYYGDKRAIFDLDFEIETGEIVGFLGLNGAGKSTTLRVLSCLLLPSSGTVQVDNVDIVEHPHEIRKRVGFLPESPPLYTDMTVETFLRFAGQLRGLNLKDTNRRLEEVLEITATADVRKEVIGNLSHGYQQRVGIGQAIIHEPQVLILDEPINGLDPRQIVQMRELVRRLGGAHTVLVSSHILSEISQTCDRILVIDNGEIVARGSEQELTAKLSGGTRLRLQIKGDKAKAVQAISAVKDVAECTPIEIGGMDADAGTDGIVLMDVVTKSDIRAELSAAVVQAELGLLQLSPVGELESVFLKLTQMGPSAQA